MAEEDRAFRIVENGIFCGFRVSFRVQRFFHQVSEFNQSKEFFFAYEVDRRTEFSGIVVLEPPKFPATLFRAGL